MRLWCALVLLQIVLQVVAQTQFCGPQGKVAITETEVDTALSGIWWTGQDNRVVYIQTRSGTLYRSGNSGKDWENQLGMFTVGRNSYMPANIVKTANPSKFYISAYGSQFPIWASDNEGVTYNLLSSVFNFTQGFAITQILPHRTLADFALGKGPSVHCYDHSGEPCHFDLYLTRDFGQTWSLVDTYVEQYAWGRSDNGTSVSSQAHAFALYTTFVDKQGNQNTLDKSTVVLMRQDLLDAIGDEPVTLYHNVLQLHKDQANDTVVFLAALDQNKGGVNLLVSEDDGMTWTKGQFPFPIQENAYTILDESEGAVLVNVQHADSSWYGSVYVSDKYAGYYSLSLKYNKRVSSGYPFWGGADFVKMSHLDAFFHHPDGFYVANHYTDRSHSYSDPLHTSITYDMGGEWHHLNPPTVDSQGHKLNCTDISQCHLNLFGMYEYVYGRFYSVPTAVGIMLGTGNVGPYLSSRLDQINTYMTRDGGHTWMEIKKGSHTYEIGDQGGLLILADNIQTTDTLLYSWNEGLNWTECVFTRNGARMDVENIVVDPNWADEQFILYGTKEGTNAGVFVHVDFRGLNERVCRNPENPGTPDSDYEYWSPYDSDDNTQPDAKKCVLGQHRTYRRRKRDAECYNPPELDNDFCFEPDETGACVLVCNWDPKTPPSTCLDTYPVTQGYRLTPGNACNVTAGLNLLPVPTKCPPPGPHPHPLPKEVNHGKVIAVIVGVSLSLAAVVGCVVGAVIIKKRQKPEVLYSLIQKLAGNTADQPYTMVHLEEEEEGGDEGKHDTQL